MKMSEIQERYEGQWVLIEYKQLDEDLNVVDGEVIAHSPSKEEVYRILMNTRGKNVAIEYVGKLLEDLAVMF